MSAQNISYHQFWNGLVETAKHLVIKELQTYPISKPEVVADVQLWVHRAVKELKLWNELHDNTKTKEVAEAIKELRDLPGAMRTAQVPDHVLWKLTSVSLLRLRPFRRTMLWDLFSNLILPREYIEERIEKTEASLTSGETAFAAFAASFSSGYENGMVVGDCRENLRGTYFLIDRAIGLRSNVVVPMRKVTTGEPESLGPILAMVVVSLPFANAFVSEFTQRLVEKMRNYEGYVELMWEYDQLAERAEFEDKPYPKDDNGSIDDIGSIIDVLTPDAGTTEMHAILPGCGVLVGEAVGSTGMAAAVELNGLHIAASRRHQSLFVQSELELEAYGIRDRCVSLTSFTSLGGTHEYQLMARFVDAQRSFEEVPLNARRIFETIGNSISKSFVSGGKVCREHRGRDTQRALFGYLLDYLVTGAKENRKKFLDDLRYSRSPYSVAFDFQALEYAIDSLNEWADTQRSNWTYLSLCIKKPVFRLVYPVGAMTYLSGFEVELLSNSETFLLGEQMPNTAHDHLRNAAHELGGPRRFIAWCRALNSLLQTVPQSEGALEFCVEGFAIRPKDSSDLVCYLPSMVLPDGATILISRDSKLTKVSILSCDNECILNSTWQLKRTALPLTTAASVSSSERIDVSGAEDDGKLMPIRLSRLSSDKALFFDLRRMHAATKNRIWHFDSVIDPSLKPLAKLVSGLAQQLPEWVASMDCLAIVPMPFNDALEIPTLAQWSQGSGRRHLLVAGILRQSAEQDVGAEWDIEVMNGKSQHDPFIERFQKLLGTMQHRQSTRQHIEALMQSQFMFTHLSHDICSYDNITTLRQVLGTQKSLLNARNRVERNLLRDSEMIVDDLEQLRLLSRGIKSTSMSRKLTIDEITKYIGPAASSAIVHAARKISRGSAKQVTIADLKPLINIKLMSSNKVKGLEPHLILVLVDNLIRNALEGAWSYNRCAVKKSRGRVCIQHRPLDHTLVIGNDAEPGRWERILQLYRGESTGNVGIKIIRLVADLLKIACRVKLTSETRGEIHLIT